MLIKSDQNLRAISNVQFCKVVEHKKMIDNLNDIIQNDNLLRAELDMKSVSSVIQMLNVHIKNQDNRIKQLEKQIPLLLPKELFDREKAYVQGRVDTIDNNSQENSIHINEIKQQIDKDKKEIKKYINQQFDGCLFQIGVEKTSLSEQIQNVNLQIEDLYKITNEQKIPDSIYHGYDTLQNQQKQINSMNKKLESIYEKYIILSKGHEEIKSTETKPKNDILLDSIQADIDTLLTKVTNLEEEIQRLSTSKTNNNSDDEHPEINERDLSQKVSFNRKETTAEQQESQPITATITFDPSQLEDLKQKFETQNTVVTDCHRKIKQLITRIRILESHNNIHEPLSTSQTSSQISEQVSASNSMLEIQKMQVPNTYDKNELVSLVCNQIKKEFDFDNYQKNCNDLKKTNVECLSSLDRKVDRQFVERLFDKFRTIINGLNENVNTLASNISGFASLKDVEELAKIIKSSQNETQCSAGKRGQVCLFCGRPRTSVTGQISRSQAVKLGFPPTAHIGSEGNVIYGDISLGNTQSQTFNPLPQLISSQ
ncbi:hypothetical protein TVAG_120760 [Trichomonas vaginalis G3]|uniref:Uncharacterized protein n=1 Tax=Trichomonas vaginalis (strain ATCC PRA-98 / G3) TaxID=412133 RepID=A2D7M1_TRIV3|nr:hypothetical protein TVAGG3_0993860 [Trichomonas vaginalis G3]EAY23738.1 hypothetical protein TVAG_120760 [Trichomonas vaginalis G3]KAI5490233.1 hypothetical protein TVAGG3_0993860 [Trichomonas vaginalis G3]|eukprot:XP_001276986.1 hypothetical protein [Trichomonas vaginalis G3]